LGKGKPARAGVFPPTGGSPADAADVRQHKVVYRKKEALGRENPITNTAILVSPKGIVGGSLKGVIPHLPHIQYEK
jgi:hypothetical protein